jgi:hypothetical protein
MPTLGSANAVKLGIGDDSRENSTGTDSGESEDAVSQDGGDELEDDESKVDVDCT